MSIEKSLRPEAGCSCPECGSENFKRLELPHVTLLVWYLNPLSVINELILGQRYSKYFLVCQDCEKTLPERTFIPCAACNTLHSTSLIPPRRQFGNWRGVACPSCEAEIPTLRSFFSRLLLWLTYPLWILPSLRLNKHRPLRLLYELEDGKPPQPQKLTWKIWVLAGIVFGLGMWILVSLLLSLQEAKLSYPEALGLYWPFSVIGGVFFGFFLWYSFSFKKVIKANGKRECSPSIYFPLLGFIVFVALFSLLGDRISDRYEEFEFQEKVDELLSQPQDQVSLFMLRLERPREEILGEIAGRFAEQISANTDFTAQTGAWIGCQSVDEIDGMRQLNDAVIVTWYQDRITEIYRMPELFPAFQLNGAVFWCWDERLVSKAKSENYSIELLHLTQQSRPFRMFVANLQEIEDDWKPQRDFGDFLSLAHDFSGLDGFSSDQVLYLQHESEQRNFRNSFTDLEKWQQEKL